MECLTVTGSILEAQEGYFVEVLPLLIGFIMSELSVYLYYKLSTKNKTEIEHSAGLLIVILAISALLAPLLVHLKIRLTSKRQFQACSLIASPGEKTRWECQRTLLYPENNYNLSDAERADVALGCVIHRNPKETCRLLPMWWQKYQTTPIPCRYYMVSASCSDEAGKDEETTISIADQAMKASVCDAEAIFSIDLLDKENVRDALQNCDLKRFDAKFKELERQARNLHLEEKLQKIRTEMEPAYTACVQQQNVR